jgi:hypothetical protein
MGTGTLTPLRAAQPVTWEIVEAGANT